MYVHVVVNLHLILMHYIVLLFSNLQSLVSSTPLYEISMKYIFTKNIMKLFSPVTSNMCFYLLSKELIRECFD